MEKFNDEKKNEAHGGAEKEELEVSVSDTFDLDKLRLSQDFSDTVGVKKALRAMVRPVREMAVMIEEQDAKSLSALPGIGPATSERVIAKLRRKMPRFALMVQRDKASEAVEGGSEVARETFDALVALGHSESDARKLIDDVMASGKKFKDTESLLTAIYQRSH